MMNVASPATANLGLGERPDLAVMRLRLIGQMEAWTVRSESVLPTGRKTRALLAAVALAAPRPVLRSRLAELLWSRRPEEQARASLRQEIHRLQDTLSLVGTDVLTVNRDSLSLRSGLVWVDVDEVLRATTTNPAALALLDGELLEELDGADPAFDAWLHAERERMRDRARDIAEALLREQVLPEAAIPVAQQLLGIDRAHEGAWRALMRAHAERGERGMAIQAYERCRSVLADLLDATPSPETLRLLADIRSGKGFLPPAQPAPASPEPVPEVRSHSPRGGAKVGVLPLLLVGTAEGESHLAVGFAEEITSALARFRWMFLVSSSSLAQFAHTTREEGALRRTFGLDYLLDGSVQRAGARLRIALRLVDLRDGNQVVWARRFDREAEDVLTAQDEIAAAVVAQIDPQILLIESSRAVHRPPQDATAYDLLLRSLPLIMRLERQQFMEAGELLSRAIELEPTYAATHAWKAQWGVFLVGQGWAADTQAVLAQAAADAERAITLDPQDGKAFAIAGHVSAVLHHRLRDAVALHERALDLNPNLVMAWALSGAAHLYLGECEEGERRLNRYKQLAPMDPHAFLFDTGFILAALMRRDHERAVVLGRSVSRLNPLFSEAYKPYLAALGHLGKVQEIAEVRGRLLAIEPGFTIARFNRTAPFEHEADRAHVVTGLRLSGVPEGE